MIDLKKYKSLLDEKIKVVCADGEVIIGEWVDWTSEEDNEPEPESITVRTKDSRFVEIYVLDIQQIEKA